MNELPAAHSRRLAPLAYHREMAAWLQEHQPALWKWHASQPYLEKHADAVRLDLLKATFRLDRQTQPALYAAADEVAKALDLDIPITFYQAQSHASGHNAAVCSLPGEGHIILQGDLNSVLNEVELRGLIGHELSHYRFWWKEPGEFGIASRILDAVTGDPRCPDSFAASCDRYRMHCEIYADRGALLACGDLNAAVGMLVKIATGVREISPAAYIEQADEIIAKGSVTTQGVTHPETFVRARALAKWSRNDADIESDVRRMIEGDLQLNALDLLGQKRLETLTRRVITELLTPAWFRSESVLAHARMFFDDFVPAATSDDSLKDALAALGDSGRDYVCYLCADFAAVDPALEELPLARGLELAEQLGLRERLETIASKELKATKKQLARLKQDGAALLAKARGGA